MTVRTVAVLLLIAVGITVYAIVFESSAPAWEGAGKVFRDVDVQDITWIEIRRELTKEEVESGLEEVPIVLERRKSGGAGASGSVDHQDWYIVEPLVFRAFLPRVQGIVWEIADMVQVTEVPPDAPDHSSWAPPGGPDLRVRFRTRQGRERLIEIGVKHPQIKRDLFVRVGGEDGRVLVTRSSVRTAFTTSVDELRSRALVPVAPQDCVRFVVRSSTDGASKGRATKSMTRLPNADSWHFDADTPLGGHIVDRSVLAEALIALNAWGVEVFEDAVKDDVTGLPGRGLSEKEVDLIVEVYHSRGDKIVLHIGRTFGKDGEKRVWIRRPMDGFVFTAKRAPVEMLWLEAEHFRTRHVFDFEGEVIAKLDCRGPDGRFVVRKETVSEAMEQGVEEVEVWMVDDRARQETFRADEFFLGEALGELRELLIEKFLRGGDEGNPGDAEGPTADPMTVTVTLTNGREYTVRFHFPSTDERDAELGVWVASRSSDPSRFLVISRWPQRLVVGSYFFRDHAISKLNPSAVNEAQFFAGPHSWTLAHLANRWSFSAEQHVVEGRELDETLLTDVVQALHADRFSVHAFTPGLPKERYAAYGIGTVQFHRKIRLTGISGRHEGFRNLTIGTRQEIEGTKDLYFARCDWFDMPFTIQGSLPRRLEKLVAHLRWVTGETVTGDPIEDESGEGSGNDGESREP